jgi:2'-5' RNA ligase
MCHVLTCDVLMCDVQGHAYPEAGSRKPEADMRLFLGIELVSELKRAAASVAKAAQSTLGNAAPRAPIRWVDPENLHITTWFLGEVDDERAKGLQAVIASPFSTPRFTLRLDGVGAFPPAGRPRVIWMGISRGTESLVALYQELAARLPAIGFEAERRAYAPHLTLARVKDIRAADAAAVRRALGSVRFTATDGEVEHLTLFRSRLSPKGSQYEALLRVPLR